MKKIFVRSPYFIAIDEPGQTGSRLELFVWNLGTTEPTDPSYTFTKDIVSATQTENVYNISNAIREYISIIKPVFSSSAISTELPQNYCFAKVKRYYKDDTNTFNLIDEETFVCFEGYTNFFGGANQNSTATFVPLFNQNLKIYKDEVSSHYQNIWLEVGEYRYYAPPLGYTNLVVTESKVYRLKYSAFGSYNLEQKIDLDPGFMYVNLFSFDVETICEPKYTPLICSFINRFGGWSFLTFFKANQQSIETKSSSFNLMPQNWNYDPYIGSNKTFNFNGTQKITCNTGWIDESHFELIQDLMVSETILLDNIPVICKTQNADYKTRLKDKNINYTINFEYNFNLLNDVI